MKKLSTKLKKVSQQYQKKIPKMIAKKLEKQIDKISDLHLEKNLEAFYFNDLPDFRLETSKGNIITNKDTFNNLYVLSFYRGSWCNYCIASNKEYEQMANMFAAEDIKVILIAPELMVHTFEDQNIKEKKMEFASDINNEFASALGITFEVDLVTKLIYRVGNVNLKKNQGSRMQKLPIPTSLIIKDNRILKYFTNSDYKQRPEVSEVLQVARDFLNK